MENFKNVYIITDMDGTLIGSNHSVSLDNINAINHFVKNGGTFSVATGRASIGITSFLENVNVNGYCVVSNGSVIYDINSDSVIHSGFVQPELLLPFIQRQIDKFPGLSVQMYTDKGLYVASNTHAIDDYIVREKVEHVLCDMYHMTDVVWNKMLFHSENTHELACIEKSAKEEFEGVFEVNFSSELYFEIMPIGYTKGDSLKRLKEMPQFAGKKFLAMGDHLNDIKMLQEADFSICPSNAKDGAKEVANMVSNVSCDESFVAWVIASLENGEIEI